MKGKGNLTWVQGNRPAEELDHTSRKNLAGGRRAVPGSKGSTPQDHGPTDRRAADGSLEYQETSGTSIFDPVLCELAYRWFCPMGGQIIDPFAGGSVRGIVAQKLRRRYWGCDLSARQIGANRTQAAEICSGEMPEWVIGDSGRMLADAPEADLIFSCPPYAHLERYSDEQDDLSTMTYPAFLDAYRRIISLAAGKLRRDRFACFVVGEVRGSDGNYIGLVPDTIRAFADAGMPLYNEAILVTALGSLPIRAGKQMTSSRKLGKTHQNVLVFVKGDGRAAADACGPVDITMPDAPPDSGTAPNG